MRPLSNEIPLAVDSHFAGIEADGGPAQLDSLVNDKNVFSPTNPETSGYTINTADGINHKNRFHIRNMFEAESVTDYRNAVP